MLIQHHRCENFVKRNTSSIATFTTWGTNIVSKIPSSSINNHHQYSNTNDCHNRNHFITEYLWNIVVWVLEYLFLFLNILKPSRPNIHRIHWVVRRTGYISAQYFITKNLHNKLTFISFLHLSTNIFSRKLHLCGSKTLHYVSVARQWITRIHFNIGPNASH